MSNEPHRAALAPPSARLARADVEADVYLKHLLDASRIGADQRQCRCDFCAGRKRRDDNWCPGCGEIQLEPPKWWEDLDLCPACEQTTLAASGTGAAGAAAYSPPTGSHRSALEGNA